MSTIKGTPVHDKKYEIFIQWLKDNKFPNTKLTLANFTNTGRGMMATEDIEAGEVIISVPKPFLITPESLTKIYGPKLTLNAHQALAMHLVLLKRESESWWKPYLDLLPTHFNTMPVTFPPTLLEHLPPSLKQEVEQQANTIEHDFLVCQEFLKSTVEKHIIQFEEYKWAWLCVNTRCIHMSKMDHVTKGDKTALAPMLDFLNHTTEAKIESGYSIKNQCFEIKTLAPYKKGEQVFINYGPHDNFAMLKEYGFALPENHYNFVVLDQEVWDLFSEIEPGNTLKTKKQILEGSGYLGDYTVNKEEISFRLMAALRLLALEKKMHAQFEKQVMEWHDVVMGQTEMISTENERKAYILLQSICQSVHTLIEKELTVLSNLSETHPDLEIHPFALYFLRQIWKESNDIIDQTLKNIAEKLASI